MTKFQHTQFAPPKRQAFLKSLRVLATLREINFKHMKHP